MSPAVIGWWCGALLAAAVGAEQPRSKPVTKDGLSLTVSLEKKTYRPNEPVDMSFTLKNETDKALFIGDGFLAPDYHETGPARHFEVHATADGSARLRFWSGMATEGYVAGTRKVFRLKPGATYEGKIRLSAGVAKDKNRAKVAHEERGGSFADVSDPSKERRHRMGKDGRKYSVFLRYQVNPKSHGVWKPPADFKKAMLWKGVLDSGKVEFEIARE